MRKALQLIFWLVLVAGVASLFAFANIRQDDMICKKLDIRIDNAGGTPLLDGQYVRNVITKAGFRVKGEKVNTIPALEIKKALAKIPYAQEVNFSVDVNGTAKAFVKQRTAQVRVMDRTNRQFYLDADLKKMPVNSDFPIRLLFASGNISSEDVVILEEQKKASEKVLNDSVVIEPKKTIRANPDLKVISTTAMAIAQNPFMNALVEQIYMNPKKEIELIPKFGDHYILVGDTTDLQSKFENLEVFYRKGASGSQWSNYREINLKFKNQVVCIKKSI